MNIEETPSINSRFDSRSAELLRKSAIENLAMEEGVLSRPDLEDYNPMLQLAGSVWVDELVLNSKDLGETREQLERMTEYVHKGLEHYDIDSTRRDDGSRDPGKLTAGRYGGIEKKGEKYILNASKLNIDLWAKEMTKEDELSEEDATNFLKGYFVGYLTKWPPGGGNFEKCSPFGLLSVIAHREGKPKQDLATELAPVLELTREKVHYPDGLDIYDKEVAKLNLVWDDKRNHYLPL